MVDSYRRARVRRSSYRKTGIRRSSYRKARVRRSSNREARMACVRKRNSRKKIVLVPYSDTSMPSTRQDKYPKRRILDF